MDIIYRKATVDDARKWEELVNNVWRNAYKDIFPEEVFIDKEKRLEEKIQKFSNLVKNDNLILYVAEHDNKIVGIMLGELHSGYPYFKDEYADLNAVYIDPKYQRMGIGRNLKNIFEEWAINRGASKYIVGVLKDNTNARNTYEAWGGVLSNYEDNFIKFDEAYIENFYEFNLKHK